MTWQNCDDRASLDWWIEMMTIQPSCTYYFGPFVSIQEAHWFLPGYIEDIEQEGCTHFGIQIKQCQPRELTVFDESTQLYEHSA